MPWQHDHSNDGGPKGRSKERYEEPRLLFELRPHCIWTCSDFSPRYTLAQLRARIKFYPKIAKDIEPTPTTLLKKFFHDLYDRSNWGSAIILNDLHRGPLSEYKKENTNWARRSRRSTLRCRLMRLSKAVLWGSAYSVLFLGDGEPPRM
jgi:hypothetical protein